MTEEQNLDCRCPEDCPLHGKCKECRRFHELRCELSFCERSDASTMSVPERSIPSGKEINLMDYGACAG